MVLFLLFWSCTNPFPDKCPDNYSKIAPIRKKVKWVWNNMRVNEDKTLF